MTNAIYLDFQQSKKPKAPEYLKINEAAQMLNLSVSTLRRRVKENKIPHIWIDGCLRFSRESLRAYMKSQERGG